MFQKGEQHFDFSFDQINLSLFSSLEEKIKYCFTCYDLNGDGYISREEMIHLMKHAIVKQVQKKKNKELDFEQKK